MRLAKDAAKANKADHAKLEKCIVTKEQDITLAAVQLHPLASQAPPTGPAKQCGSSNHGLLSHRGGYQN